MFDSIKNNDTFVHNVNPVTKIIAAAALFVIVVFTHNPNTLLYFVCIMAILLFTLSGIQWRYLCILLGVILVSGLLSSTYMILYGKGDTTLFKLGIIHVTEESFIRGIHITMRGVILSLFGALVIFTLKITDVFYALMIHFKIKSKYAYSFMAAINMIPLIFSEYVQLRRARKVRAPLIDKKRISGFKGLRMTIVTLMSQSIRRAYRLGIAMESKGFSDNQRTYYRQTTFSFNDIFFVITILIALLISSYLGINYPIFNTSDAR